MGLRRTIADLLLSGEEYYNTHLTLYKKEDLQFNTVKLYKGRKIVFETKTPPIYIPRDTDLIILLRDQKQMKSHRDTRRRGSSGRK